MSDFTYKRLPKEYIIWPGTQMAEENINVIYTQMLLLVVEDPDSDIYLYINSPGESVAASVMIYDTMQYIKPDVVTVMMGMVVSMGRFLLTAGAKGKRFAVPHARILMHRPLGGVQGTASEMWINVDLILAMKNEPTQITAERTEYILEEVTRDTDCDHWYAVQKALGYGFVDAVIRDTEAMEKGE